MENINNPVVTISADEYFNLRSRAESSAYMAQKVEEFRTELNNCRNGMCELDKRIQNLETKSKV